MVTSVRCKLLATLALLVAAPATAGNVFDRGHFDFAWSDDDWRLPAAGGRLAHVPDVDADGCPSSGAELATNTLTTLGEPKTASFSVCVKGIEGRRAYRFGAHAFFPEGQGVDGSARIELRWSTIGSCLLVSPPVSTAAVTTDTPQEWLGAEGWAWSPDGATDALLTVHLTKTENGSELPLTMFFDRAFVAPADDLFVDGFEIGDACRWSLTQGGGEV